MAETDVDRRAFMLLLTSHGLLSGADAAAIVAWADVHGVGLYQLPLPVTALRPLTASGRPSRPRAAELRDERAELVEIFAELGVYAAAGYRVLGLAVREAEARTRAGRGWTARVVDLAAQARLELAVWSITPGADVDALLAVPAVAP